MSWIVAGTVIGGIGLLRDLIKTYQDWSKWEETDMHVDEEWLPLVVEKGILDGDLDDYHYSSPEKVATREAKGTHSTVYVIDKKKKQRSRVLRKEGELVLMKKIEVQDEEKGWKEALLKKVKRFPGKIVPRKLRLWG
jgi:hypothetical protein